MIAYSTGDDDGGGCGWDEEPYCRGHIWWRLWLPGEVRMVPPVRVIGVAIWGNGWWLVLTHNIGMFSHHIPY